MAFIKYDRTDLVNAGFELVACVLAWRSVFELVADHTVRGVYPPQIAWSAVWGLWCLPYYWRVQHRLSFSVSAVRELATLVWVALLWRYS